MELERLIHGGRHTKNISDRVPNEGKAKGLPSGGMPRKGWYTDGDDDVFFSRHVRDTVIILEEGNLPHPRCSRCDMLVPWRALNGKHHDTAMCRSGAERKRRRMAETEL